eukprot:14748737-Alexandrium_andersonii.AAC.1
MCIRDRMGAGRPGSWQADGLGGTSAPTRWPSASQTFSGSESKSEFQPCRPKREVELARLLGAAAQARGIDPA